MDMSFRYLWSGNLYVIVHCHHLLVDEIANLCIWFVHLGSTSICIYNVAMLTINIIIIVLSLISTLVLLRRFNRYFNRLQSMVFFFSLTHAQFLYVNLHTLKALPTTSNCMHLFTQSSKFLHTLKPAQSTTSCNINNWFLTDAAQQLL